MTKAFKETQMSASNKDNVQGAQAQQYLAHLIILFQDAPELALAVHSLSTWHFPLHGFGCLLLSSTVWP